MKSIRVLVVEDEVMVAKRIVRMLLEGFTKFGVQADIEHAKNLTDAISMLESNSYELVTLDLNLNGVDGFKLLKLASCKPSHTVIISAYREQAVRAYEYGVLDYVAKPFSLARLEKSIDRFLRQSQKEEPKTKYLVLKDGSTLFSVETSNIKLVNGVGNYSKVVMTNNSHHLHDKGMDALMDILPSEFIRAHKSYIVNLRKTSSIESLGAGKFQLTLQDGDIVPVGRSKIDGVREAFKKHRLKNND